MVIYYNRDKWKSMYKVNGGGPITRYIGSTQATMSFFIIQANNGKIGLKLGARSCNNEKYGEFNMHKDISTRLSNNGNTSISNKNDRNTISKRQTRYLISRILIYKTKSKDDTYVTLVHDFAPSNRKFNAQDLCAEDLIICMEAFFHKKLFEYNNKMSNKPCHTGPSMKTYRNTNNFFFDSEVYYDWNNSKDFKHAKLLFDEMYKLAGNFETNYNKLTQQSKLELIEKIDSLVDNKNYDKIFKQFEILIN